MLIKERASNDLPMVGNSTIIAILQHNHSKEKRYCLLTCDSDKNLDFYDKFSPVEYEEIKSKWNIIAWDYLD